MSNFTAPAPRRATSKIRGRRYVLFDVDIESEIARPLAMGKSAAWLMLLGRDLPCPRVVAVDASEATEIARAGVLSVDDTTVAGIARACRMSKRHAQRTLTLMLAEAATARTNRGKSTPLFRAAST